MEMTEEENYTDLDITDVIEDSEHFAESENLESTENDTLGPNQDFDINTSEISSSAEKKPQSSKSETIKTTRLPIARIKHIMKMDPDVHMINADAAFVVAKATEMFLETIAKETYAYTLNKKRKIITKKDLDHVINLVDCLCFLEGALDF